MNTGILALLIPCIAGIIVAQRLFRLGDALNFLPVGLCSGWLTSAMMTNLALRAGLSLERSMMSASLFCVALSALLLVITTPPEKEGLRLSPWTWLYLAAFSTLVYFTSVSFLFLHPDDDFWLHAPMQAQLLKGNFPLSNPVFPDLAYGGHYARDLSIVMFSQWSGINLYASQAPITAFFQLAAFWLIFIAGLRYGRSEITATLTTLFLFMGVNAAGRGGWLDTVSNNNPLAQAHTALLVFLFLRVLLERVSWGQVVGTAVLFAGLAWSYETNFVAIALALLVLAALVTLKGELRRRQLAITAVIIFVSVGFLGLQGGSMGELFVKLLRGSPAHSQKSDLTTQAQNLEVSVKFPKEQLFQIKLARAGDEISMAYYTFPWLQRFDISPQEPGYVSVFSSTVWRIHWLSLYLCPLTLVFLWRYNNKLGFLLWGYGFASYFLPAVIDFGLWEIEVFRWEYAASCGFAGALGVALGEWLHSKRGPVFEVQEHTVRVERKLLAYLLAGILIWLNCYPTWVQVERRTAQLPSLKNGFVMANTSDWLAFHPVLGLSEADLRAGLKMAPLVRTGETFLMMRRAQSPSHTLPESAFVGLTGVQTLGHAFPLQCERLGTTPFRQSAPAIAFWATGKTDLLKNWKLDWLYVKEDGSHPKLPRLGALKEVIRESSPSGDRVIYRVNQDPFSEATLLDREHPRVKLTQVEGLQEIGNEEYRQLEATISRHPSLVGREQILTYRYFDPETNAEIPYEEGMSQSVTLSNTNKLPFSFVSPHNPGRYLVKMYLGGQDERSLIGGFTLDTTHIRAFHDLQVDWSAPSEPLQGGLVQSVKLNVTNPTGVNLKLKGLAGLTAATPEQPYPARDFQPLDVVVGPNSTVTIELLVVPPRAAGEWPFELFFNPKDALKTFQLPARTVVY